MKYEEHLEIIQCLRQEVKLSLGLKLEELARDNGTRLALQFEDDKITYARLNAGANRYANCFAKLGFKKGDVVAILMKNRPEYIMAVCGLSKLGIIASLIDVGIRGEVLAQDINLCEPRAVIVGAELLPVFAEIEPRLRLHTPALVLIDGEEEGLLTGRMQALVPLLGAAGDHNPTVNVTISNEDILAYLYTPGQSGGRKVVPASQKRCLIKAHLFGMYGHMNEDSIQYMCLPLHYNGGFIGACTAMIVNGGAMVLRQKFSVHNFWNDLRSCGANYMITVGEIGHYLYNQPLQEDDQDNPLEVMICSGMGGSLIDAFRIRFGIKNIIEIYSKTEGIGNFVNYNEIPDMCGNLILLDERQGEIIKYDFKNKMIKRNENGWGIKCTPGEEGVLICEINQMNRFYPYVNDFDSSEKALLKDVFQTGDQYFFSGDLMSLHENDYISYVDRLGDTYRWKGRTVSANQVADVIRKYYGGIEDAVVYAVKIPKLEGRCGMAVIKLMEDEHLDLEGFTKHINRRMPEHARPLFLRLVKEFDGDQDNEDFKEMLRQEGFDPNKIKNPLYFLDPQLNKYVPLQTELYQKIIDQEILL